MYYASIVPFFPWTSTIYLTMIVFQIYRDHWGSQGEGAVEWKG
jgi:hypothetical protein